MYEHEHACVHAGHAYWKLSYYACDVTLSVYPHRASLKNMPDHDGGNRTYDLWNTSPVLCQLSYAVLFRNITYSNQQDRVAQLAEHWAGIPKVVGSIPTVVRHEYITPEYITPTQSYHIIQ